MLDVRLALPDDTHHMAVADKPVKIRCMQPGHRAKDHEQSMAVYPDHIHCYGCDFHLEGRERCIRYLLGTETVEFARYTSEKLDAYRERAAEQARTDPLPLALAEAYQEVLCGARRKHRLSWLTDRGLTVGTIDAAHLGHDGFRFVIPVFGPDSRLLTLRFRRDDEYNTSMPKYLGLPGRNGLYLYEPPLLGDDPRTVVLCEGELDALRLWQEGQAAVSVTNGARQMRKAVALIRARFPNASKLIIASDQDDAGDAAAEEVKEAACAAGYNTFRYRWAGDAKDVTDALQAGLTLVKERF